MNRMNQRRNNSYFHLAICVIFLFLFCSCENQSPTGPDMGGGRDTSDLQGTWMGYEVGGPSNVWTVAVSGHIWHVTESAPGEEWYRGTFLLNPYVRPKQYDFFVTGCYNPEGVGLMVSGIYRLDGDTLTCANNAPGDPVRPTSFNPTNRTRVWVFTKQ